MKRKLLAIAAVAALLSVGYAPANAGESDSNDKNTELNTGNPKKKKKSSSSSSSSVGSKVTSVLGGLLGGSSSSSDESSETETSSSSSSSSGSGLLGGLLGGSSSSSGSGLSGLASALTTVFDGGKAATANKIVGTWKYTEPAVVFESDNALKNIGGKVASASIEKKLQSQFEKYGITKGKMTMTFDRDGNFTQTIGTKTMKGTYTLDGSNVNLKYSSGMKQFVGTTQLDGNSLLIVMDASKLLKYAGTIGKLTGNSTASTLSSLLGSYDGMEVGMKLEK